MGRPRKLPLIETPQGEPVPAHDKPKHLTPADLGYKPGDTVSLADLNRLMGGV